MEKIRLALCQNVPQQQDVEKNVSHALDLVESAAKAGAGLVSLPEMFYHPYELAKLPPLARLEEETRAAFSRKARELGIHLCTGSIVSHCEGKNYNRTFLYGPDGELIHEYSKCHLFDVSFKGLTVKESDYFSPGEEIVCTQTSLGTIGTAICYDVRFPELFRTLSLKGAELVLVPAVFNHISGPAHWHITMRTRAVENQFFLAAISQGKSDKSSYRAYGHSMVVSPWGEVLAEAGVGEEIIYADLDPSQITEARERLPLLRHRRTDLY
ncbi:MAG: carbon-nitrogen hydrolase family protein [Chitinispirillaceae bacterium]